MKSKNIDQLKHNRAFRLLLVGSSVSMLGSRLTVISYPMLILYLTGSPADAGLAVFIAMMPSILVYIPAGVLVDRWDPRRTMLMAELGRGLAMAVIVVSLASYRPSVPLITGMAGAEEILGVFAMLAERLYVRALVEQRNTSSALVRIEARTHATVLAGRPLGGFLFGIKPVIPFLADVFTFIVSVITLLSSSGHKEGKPPIRISYSHAEIEMRTGLRWLQGDDFARAAIPLTACMTLISQALIIVFLTEARIQHLSSVVIGTILAASGAGGALGAMAGSRLPVLSHHSRVKIQPFIWSVALLVLALSRLSWQTPCIGAVMTVLGFTGAMGNVELGAYIIRSVPQGLLARVTSVGALMSFSACAAGPVLGGILVENYGIRYAELYLCAITLVSAAFSIHIPSMRSLKVLAIRAT